VPLDSGKDTVLDDRLKESFQSLVSTTKSAAADFVDVAKPVLVEAAGAVKKSVTDGDETVSTRQVSDSAKDPLLDDRFKESFQRLAGTTQSAVTTFVQVAKPVLVDATDAVRKSVADNGESSQELKPNQDGVSSEHEQTNGEVPAPVRDANMLQSKGNTISDATNNEWRESLERLASTTKSASTSLSHLAAPIFGEATEAIKKAIPDTPSAKQSQMRKYGGVGYLQMAIEDDDEKRNPAKDK
jgi:hypothetical protein